MHALKLTAQPRGGRTPTRRQLALRPHWHQVACLLVEFFLTTSRQLVFAARARTRTPGHQFVTTNQRSPVFRITHDFPQQHPCKQRHSTPKGGMCKKRLHVITPGCPCATVESILLAFTPRAHKFLRSKVPQRLDMQAAQSRPDAGHVIETGAGTIPRLPRRHGIDAWTTPEHHVSRVLTRHEANPSDRGFVAPDSAPGRTSRG